MAGLTAPLGFSLGGDPFAPFIINLEPSPDDLSISAASPIRFSVRDVETYVVAGQLQVSVGYAHVRAVGDIPYDDDLDGVFITSAIGGVFQDVPADVVEVVDGIEITKNVSDAQRSTYFVGFPLVVGDLAVCATAEIRPDLISVDADGAVFGIEHGYRNTAAYMFFTNPSGASSIRIAGPENTVGVRSPDVEITFDWTSVLRRYIILWNEIKDRVEFYVEDGGTTQLLHTEPIISFQEFESLLVPGTPSPKRGDETDATMLWGIEGPSGDRVTFANVALATDVGFPIIGISRPGNYVTARRSDELVRFSEGDPRRFAVSSWFGPEDAIFSNTDTAGVAEVLKNGVFSLTKETHGTTYAIYREEPAFLSSENEGLMFEVRFSVVSGDIVDGRAVGMGFMLYDGQSIWQFNLFGGSISTIGMYKAGGGAVSSASNHMLPVSSIDWSTSTTLRFVIDPRRALVEIYDTEVSLSVPILEKPFDRGSVPTADEVGLAGSPSFIAFGHLNTLDTTGSLLIEDFKYASMYRGYEPRDGLTPEAADLSWLRVAAGFDVLSPLGGLHLLGGGFGPTPLGYFIAGTGTPVGEQALDNDQLLLTNSAGVLQIFKRGTPWDSNRGMVMEARLQITSSKLQARSGIFLVLDDGLHSYMLSFVDTPVGRFCGVAVRSGLNSFIEKVGTTGEAADLSFKMDWDQPHTYRMELRRLDGLYIFVDNDPEPRLVIPESANVDFPSSQFLSPTTAWGQFSKEGSVSRWDFVRTIYSRGYEVSFKKSKPDSALEDDIGNTQAIVVAFAEDND